MLRPCRGADQRADHPLALASPAVGRQYSVVRLLCFAADGTTIGPKGGYVEQSDLADGATGSFSISPYGNECPIGLAAASGYGSL